jgi:hypothetical protein
MPITYTDIARLRDPRFLTPGAKPIQPVRIDENHQWSDKLLYGWVPIIEWQKDLHGNHATYTPPASGYYPAAIAAYSKTGNIVGRIPYDATTGAILTLKCKRNLGSSEGVTLAGKSYKIAGATSWGGFQRIFYSSSSYNVSISAGSPNTVPKFELRFDTGSSLAQQANTGNSLGTIEQPLTWIVRFTPGAGSNIKLRVNGVDKTSALSYTENDNVSGRTVTAPIQFGRAVTSMYFAAEYIYVFSGEFSDGECQSLERNPYQLVRPI